MFNIYLYNTCLAILLFTFFFLLLFIFFKSKIYTIIDPLVMHLLWLSANLSFLFVFYIKYGINYFLLLFLNIFAFYIFFLYIFLVPISKRKAFYFDFSKIKMPKLLFLYFIIILLVIYGDLSRLEYLTTSKPSEWVLYRFVALEIRDPIKKIIRLGSEPLFFYFTFLFIFILKKFKLLTWSIIITKVILDLITGGRSTLLHVIFSFGAFLLYYKDLLVQLQRKINIYGFFLVILAILFSVIITSKYDINSNYKHGMMIILNRIFASADGLEYYMVYDASNNLQSGFTSYLMSIFGIYLKRFWGSEYKNIGTQLLEIASSSEFNFAQGPNYTLPLQVMVLGYYTLPLYVLFASYLTAKLRNITPHGSIAKQIVFFFLMSNSFILIYDIEYGLTKIVSFFIVYTVFIYPILKLNFSFTKKEIT